MMVNDNDNKDNYDASNDITTAISLIIIAILVITKSFHQKDIPTESRHM